MKKEKNIHDTLWLARTYRRTKVSHKMISDSGNILETVVIYESDLAPEDTETIVRITLGLSMIHRNSTFGYTRSHTSEGIVRTNVH